MAKFVSIVIPAHNEEGSVNLMIEQLSCVFSKLPHSYQIILVDDGSSDNTLHRIKEIAANNHNVFFIELSTNFGHQSALKAGLDHANGDCVITLDCDLQHPPELIPELISKWEEGYDVVYTKRNDCKKVPFGKRVTSRWFYRFMNSISDIDVEEGTADFRLMDKKVVNVFRNFSERDPFIRGLVKWMGYKQFALNYQPSERVAGKTKYTFRKMIRLAMQGVTSFSVRPLHLAVYMGFIFSFASLFLLYLPYVVYSLVTDNAVSGWASVIMTIVFFGGIQLIVLGIIGIYIGKMFLQTKERPNYIVRSSNLK